MGTPSSKPMRILWVKPGGLWPLNTGGRLRSFHTVAELSRRHRVVAADDARTRTTIRGSWPPSFRTASAWLRSLTRPPKQGSLGLVGALARSWFSRLPVDLWKWRVPALRAEAAPPPGEGRGGPLRGRLPGRGAQRAAGRSGAGRALRAQRRAHHLEAPERRRAPPVAAAGPGAGMAQDASLRGTGLRAGLAHRRRVRRRSWLSGRRAPSARASRRSPPASTRPSSRPTGEAESAAALVFTGSMDWYPNEDAILHFAQDILPLIRREVPEASLTVVGRKPSARLQAGGRGPGIAVTGTVDDIRPYVQRGRRLRRAPASGRRHAAEDLRGPRHGKGGGLDDRGRGGPSAAPGEHFIRSDDPGGLRRGRGVLLRDPARRQALGAAGRRLMEERYAWARGEQAVRGSMQGGTRADERQRLRAGLRGMRDGGLPGAGGARGHRRRRQRRTRSRSINAGASPVVEPGLGELIARVVSAGALRATTSGRGGGGALGRGPDLRGHARPLQRPARRGGPRRAWARRSARRCAAAGGPHGRAPQHGAARHDRGGAAPQPAPGWARRRGRACAWPCNPEFMREGSSLRGLRAAAVDPRRAPTTRRRRPAARPVRRRARRPSSRPSVRTAEMVKYVANAFHALKVCFANEIGDVCDALGADAQEVMRIFLMDRKLSVSEAYLRPGFAFGGSCLPKDVRALLYGARSRRRAAAAARRHPALQRGAGPPRRGGGPGHREAPGGRGGPVVQGRHRRPAARARWSRSSRA